LGVKLEILSYTIKTKGRSILSIGVAISLLLSILPTEILSQLPNENFNKNIDIQSERNFEKTSNRPRLMKIKKEDNSSTFVLNPNLDENIQNNKSIFSIDSQSGSTNANISIKDSYSWTGTETINTSNDINPVTGLPTNHNDSVTISHSSDYNRQNGWFNISNVMAEKDYQLKEDYEYDRGFVNSKTSEDAFYEIAMSFSSSEDFFNLTKIYTYTSESANPSGLIYVVNSTLGKPDDTKILSSKLSLIPSNNPQWNEYEFNEPIILKGGIKYFIVMNSTSTNKVWKWYYQNDTLDDGVDEGDVYYKKASHAQIDWTFWNAADLPLIIEVLPTKYNGSIYQTKTYNNLRESSLSYNTSVDNTTLSSPVWFEWNDTETHRFHSNISLSFTLDFIANYNFSSNPINGSINYFVYNATTSEWSVIFSTKSLNKTYSVRNRTITIQNLNVDWNGSAILHNGSYVYNLTNSGGLNASITYVNSSSVMFINASSLSDAKEWNITFEAPNYVLDFNWMLNTYPVTSANVTDTLIPNISFDPRGIGGKNLSVFIETSLGSQIYNNTNRNITAPLLDDWDIYQSTLSLPEANGTYYSTVYWFNGTSNQIGFFTRDVKVFINTTLIVEAPSEIILNNSLNITVRFNATHNDTAINGANVTGKPSWGSQKSEKFTQIVSFGPYNLSFDINDSQHNPGDLISITIVCQLAWYINQSAIIAIKVVDNAVLNINNLTLKLQWRENTTLLMYYNDSSGDPIPGAEIFVIGDSENVSYNSGAYFYTLYSTNFPGVGFYPDNLIFATHSNYTSSQVNFSVTITPGDTSINTWSKGQPILNNTPEYTRIYANSSMDNVSINISYYSIITNETLSTSSPVVASLLPYYVPFEELNNTWTLTFNPNQTGSFIINISFSLTNYNTSVFCFHLSVKKGETTIYSELSTPENIYYNEESDFFLVYNNINYNENITGLTNISGITIDNTSKVLYLNSIGDFYWFKFAPSPLALGIHVINITFDHIYYNRSSINLTFNVILRPTGIEGADALNGTNLINGTSSYTRFYSPSSYDNFSFSLRYYDNRTDQTLVVLEDNINISAHSSIDANYATDGSNNWTFILDGSLIGTYQIQITFTLENYHNSTFIVSFILKETNSSIGNQSVDLGLYPIEIDNGSDFYFWVTWMSDYNEPIIDSNIDISNPIYVVLNSTDEVTGNHTFKFTPTITGSINITLTFETTNYTATTFNINITSTEATSASINATTLVLEWRKNTTIQIWYNNSAGSPITGATIIVDADYQNPALFDVVSEAYYYKLNSTKFLTIGNYSSIQINASYFFHRNQTIFFDLIILPGNTSISCFSDGIEVYNDTTVIEQPFASSSADELNISLSYYHSLSTDILDVGTPILESLLPFSMNEINSNWTIMLYPNTTGSFIINITFSLSNYKSSKFIFHLNVEKAATTIYHEVVNGTNVFYNESFDFSLLYVNSDYNENITGLVEDIGIIIDNKTKIEFLYWSGNYSMFRFSPTPLSVASYSITITLEDIKLYNASVITVLFNIIPLITNITSSDALDGSIIENNSKTFYRHFSPSSFDNFSIWLRYYDLFTDQTLIVPSISLIETDSSIYVDTPIRDETSYNWSLTFDASIIGTYTITITFSLDNYSACKFIVFYTIQKADTKISKSSINSTPSQNNVKSNSVFEFWIEWQNEYNECINDSNGVMINSSDIFLINTDPINGNHTFRFIKNDVGMYTYNLTFETENYTKASFIVRFNVINRLMILDGSLSSHNTGTTVSTLMYGDIYHLVIFLNDSETGIPVTANPISPNITFSGVIAGNHSFYYEAFEIGIFSSLNITFNLNNYFNYSYTITFIVNKRKIFFDTNLSTLDNASVPVQVKYNNTYYFNIFLRDQKTQNPVNASIVIVHENLTEYPMLFSGNHSFSYFAGAIGQQLNLSIVFFKSNYFNLTYFISFNIFSRAMVFDLNLSTHPTPAAVNLQYGDIYFFKIYIKDNETAVPLTITNPIENTQNLIVVNISNGFHWFRFQAWKLQHDTANITFSLNNYNSLFYQIIFSVTEANSEVVSQSLRISTTYLLNKEFFLIWQSIPNPSLNISQVLFINTSNLDIQFSSSEWTERFFFQNCNNGNYSFFILANKVGTFTVVLNFNAEGFKNASIQIEILILLGTTNFSFTDPVNSSFKDEPFYFTESQNITIVWIETINGNGLVDTEPEYKGNGTEFLVLVDWFPNGTYVFNFRADKIGIFQVKIIFNITNYQVSLYFLTINVSAMKTIEPNVEYPSELIVGEQLSISVEGWFTINQDMVPISNLDQQIRILNGSELIPYTITGFAEDRFTVIVTTEDFNKGEQNLHLSLLCNGYENQSVDISLNMIGRKIVISIEIVPEEIVQGSEFKVEAILEYESLISNISGSGAGLSLKSLEGVEVNFEVEILYENGHIKTLYNTTQAQLLGNTKGIALFMIRGEYTVGAEGVNRITVYSSDTASGQAGFSTTPEDYIETYQFKKRSVENPLFINPIQIMILIILLVLISITLISLKSYQNRKKTQKDIQNEIESRFKDLLNLRGILCRNNHGILFYGENFRFKDQDGDLIAGITTAMSTLVDQVSAHSLEEGEFDILERGKFGIFSHQGKFSVLSLVSSGKLSKYTLDRLVTIHKQIEGHFNPDELDSILNGEIKGEVKRIIYDNLPLGLLKPLLVENAVLKAKLNTFKKTEKKIYQIIHNVPSFIEGLQVFYALTLISSLTAQGITLTDAILFLEKLHNEGGLRNLTPEESHVYNIPEEFISI
jgi:hypothetical protein